MKAEELEALKARLEAERQRLLEEVGYLESRFLRNAPREASGDLSGYAFHLADAGTDTEEREKAVQITSAEGRLLAEIDAALARVASGAYGFCSTCGGEIGIQRLAAVPSATRCIACKELEEQGARSSG